MQALREALRPQNASEMRSFLGMAQYIARFSDDFATITEPLCALTKQDSEWHWTKEEEDVFERVKPALSGHITLAYFDPKKHTEIHVDTSPGGIAGISRQNGRPVAYASRSLTSVGQRCSQTEREAFAVVWACEHFTIFVSGAPFTVVTDHRPLITIWDEQEKDGRTVCELHS